MLNKSYDELIRMTRDEVIEQIASGQLVVDYTQDDLVDGHISHPTNHNLVYVDYPKKSKVSGSGDKIEDFYNYNAKPKIYIEGFRYLQ